MFQIQPPPCPELFFAPWCCQLRSPGEGWACARPQAHVARGAPGLQLLPTSPPSRGRPPALLSFALRNCSTGWPSSSAPASLPGRKSPAGAVCLFSRDTVALAVQGGRRASQDEACSRPGEWLQSGLWVAVPERLLQALSLTGFLLRGPPGACLPLGGGSGQPPRSHLSRPS